MTNENEIDEEYISASEYAKAKNVTPEWVRRLIAQGTLPGKKVGARWYVPKTFSIADSRPDLGECRILTLFSHAGGVGKTTLARELGYLMANYGYKTLLIDTDPQANLSVWILGEEQGKVRDEQTLLNLTRNGCLPDPIQTPHSPNLGIIPAKLSLTMLEMEIGRTPGGDLLLRQALAEEMPKHYDIVLVDSPPYISQITALAGLAGEGFIVPIETSSKGLESLTGLFTFAQTFAKASGKRYLQEWIRLLVPSRYDPRTNVDNGVLAELDRKKTEGFRVSSAISNRPGVHKRACMLARPITDFQPLSEAAREMEAVAFDVVDILTDSKQQKSAIQEGVV